MVLLVPALVLLAFEIYTVIKRPVKFVFAMEICWLLIAIGMALYRAWNQSWFCLPWLGLVVWQIRHIENRRYQNRE